MKFSVSQEQAKQLLALLAQQENGFHQVMQRCLEAMMRAEREAYNSQHGTQSNGFRSRRCFGRGQMLELRVPRTRQGGFYPVLLQVLKNQDAEMERLTQTLYSSGLTGLCHSSNDTVLVSPLPTLLAAEVGRRLGRYSFGLNFVPSKFHII